MDPLTELTRTLAVMEDMNGKLELTHTLAAMTDMNGKLKMQTAVYRWAVANHAALDMLGLTDSLIKACEQELEKETK